MMAKLKKECYISTLCVVLFAVFSTFAEAAEKPSQPAFVCVQESKIVNKTDSPKANFRTLIDRVKVTLMEGGFSVKDEQDMADALTEQGKAENLDGMEGDEPIDGGLKVPGYFIRMSVLQYGFSTQRKPDPMTPGREIINKFATVEISFFIVNARNGASVKSVIAKCDPVLIKTTRGMNGNFEEQALQTATDFCIKKLVGALMEVVPAKFRPKPMTGKVLGINKKTGRVIVNLNSDNVKQGALLDVFRLVSALDDDDAEDSDDDDDLSELMDEIYVGTVKVVEVKEKFSSCEIIAVVDANAKIEKKNIVKISTRFKAGEAAMQLPPAAPPRKVNPAAPF